MTAPFTTPSGSQDAVTQLVMQLAGQQLLSKLLAEILEKMTPEQKTEMRRRYVDFVRRLAKPPAAASRVSKTAKWVPAKKVH